MNPPNAALNYADAILESEARLAAAELGLDPGLGVEPVRPLVDAYVFDWLSHGPLQRNWFFEEVNGNCRLMGEFAAVLPQTAMTWRKAVAPYAEEAPPIARLPRLEGPPLGQDTLKRCAIGILLICRDGLMRMCTNAKFCRAWPNSQGSRSASSSVYPIRP
jgi:hypothetical protein